MLKGRIPSTVATYHSDIGNARKSMENRFLRSISKSCFCVFPEIWCVVEARGKKTTSHARTSFCLTVRRRVQRTARQIDLRRLRRDGEARGHHQKGSPQPPAVRRRGCVVRPPRRSDLRYSYLVNTAGRVISSSPPTPFGRASSTTTLCCTLARRQ